jgi:hypothetical protein
MIAGHQRAIQDDPPYFVRKGCIFDPEASCGERRDALL